jgi:hypothetical protein
MMPLAYSKSGDKVSQGSYYSFRMTQQPPEEKKKSNKKKMWDNINLIELFLFKLISIPGYAFFFLNWLMWTVDLLAIAFNMTAIAIASPYFCFCLTYYFDGSVIVLQEDFLSKGFKLAL